jgi:hypothetical protein
VFRAEGMDDPLNLTASTANCEYGCMGWMQVGSHGDALRVECGPVRFSRSLRN